MRAVPDLIDAYLEYAAPHERPDIYKTCAVVSLMALMMERRLVFKGRISIFPNLYMFLIGGPATRKSSATDDIVRLYKAVHNDNELYSPITQLTDLGLYKRLEALCKTQKETFQGKTYQTGSAFIYGSEARDTLKALYTGGSLNTTLTDLYNCGGENTAWSLMPSNNRITGTRPQVLFYNPCVNLLACSTSEWFSNIVKRSDLEGGFGSRLMLGVYAGKQYDDDENCSFLEDMQPKEKELDLKIKETLLHITKQRGIYKADDAWKAFYKARNSEHKRWNTANQHTEQVLVFALARKMMPNFIKLSMIYAMAESDELVLRERHAIKAWQFLSLLERDLPLAFEKLDANQDVAKTWQVWGWIVSSGHSHVSMAQVFKAFERTHGIRDLTIAVDHLTKLKYLIPSPGEMLKVMNDKPVSIRALNQFSKTKP